MAEDYTEMDILLAKHLAGEADAAELKTIQSWLDASEANQRYFEGLRQLWKEAPQTRREWPVDTEAALQKVKTQMHAAPVLRARTSPVRIWRLAAAAILFFAVAVWLFRRPTGLAPVDLASSNATLTDTLSDGSTVVLNRHTGLRIAENFNRKERRMRLTGEAYFHVAHDTTRPFIVEAGQLEIRVVGTEFNVDNRPEMNKVVVSVTTGKVRLQTTAQAELLTAGQQAEYEPSSGKITRLVKPDLNVLAYKNRQFVFDATPLSEVVRQLSDVYGVRIYLKNRELANCPLNTHFNNLDLNQVLDIIAESFSLRIERSADGISLDGAGCEPK
jgi:ferric-dicitrate binding protein FerR (iron transport regulator)